MYERTKVVKALRSLTLKNYVNNEQISVEG